MDFRFAGFISVSLFAHLLVLVTGAAPVSPKIGGEASTLSVTLLSNPQPAPPVPGPVVQQTPLPVAAEPAAPASVARAVIRPAAHVLPVREKQLTAARAETATVATAAAPAAPPVRTQLSAALQNELAEKFDYPWLARKRGWQGRVTLSLHIAKNGDLSRWKVARTSGHQLLDRSALDSAKRIHSLPEAAALLNGTALDLMVPVHYQLLDS